MKIVNCAWFIILFSLPLFIFAETLVNSASVVASRTENGSIFYYNTLHDAFEAASGMSIDNPDVITLLSDIVLDDPIIIDSDKHIRLLVAGSRTIMRGSGNLEYPLFWLRGRNASLSLGNIDMTDELIIDGGYLNSLQIISHSPLITLNGPGTRLVMYDNVYLQNNYNNSTVPGTGAYQLGSGVFIRTIMEHTTDLELKAEFIMKGGTIRGNTNNTQDVFPYGGGVLIGYLGIFSMEGGVIMNNTAYRSGGGVQIDSAGSFRKTGGIIYGENADDGYKNIVINGHADPQYFGHALAVFSYNFYSRFRDDTVEEHDHLSYLGQASGIGVFGEGEKWSTNERVSNALGANTRLPLIIVLSSLAILVLLVLFIVINRTGKKSIITGQEGIIETSNINIGVKLSPREREVFDLFLSGYSAKETALRLGLTISSINLYSANLYRKLGIQSRTELLVKFK